MTDLTATLKQSLKLAFPPVMLELLREAVKPEADFEVIARLLSRDPILTVTVLNLANSPYYSSGQKVSDLFRAATVLGTKEILKIALSLVYQKRLEKTFKKHNLDFFASWRMMIWSALASEAIAERLCPEDANKAYILALLKDISLLLAIDAAPQSLAVGKHALTKLEAGQLEHERRNWGADHCSISVEVLSAWNLDIDGIDCISRHHDLDNLSEHDLICQAIILGTYWSELELGTDTNPALLIHLTTLLKKRLGVDDREVSSLRRLCAERFTSVLSALGISETRPDDHYYQHSLALMREYYFLAMEISHVSGGLLAAAKVIGGHLEWQWGVREWELALCLPNSTNWTLFSCKPDHPVVETARSSSLQSLPFALKPCGLSIEASGMKLGDLRLGGVKIAPKTAGHLGLYLRFVSQAYENYCLRHFVYEVKAHILDVLPVGVARLDLEGKLLEFNDRMAGFMSCGEMAKKGFPFWECLRLGHELGPDRQWEEFLKHPEHGSLSKIFCLPEAKKNGQEQDVCLYLLANKRSFEGNKEILLLLEDVTSFPDLEKQAIKQGEFLERLVNAMRELVFTLDPHGQITYVSPKYSGQLLNKNLFELAKPLPSFTGVWDCRMLKSASSPVEVVLPFDKSSPKTMELVFAPLPSSGRQIPDYLVVGRDITMIRRLEEKLKRQAIFDGLTGLFNHFQFYVLIDREYHRSKRTGRPFGLMFFDLDGFKAFNDNYGHQVGDEVLREVGNIMRASIRRGTDYPCRYGGDEFVIIATEISEQNLETLAERINIAVKEKYQDKLGLSAGLAILNMDESSDELLRRTDHAAHLAKQAGGHRTVWSK